MSDIIHLLSDDLANKIAAGEVVVRPAAVVKELLENSIDSGAGEIQLIIKDGGKSLIQVVDNGSGMSETDARMSFERHATSKINTIDDLYAIKTMGFRGEALASIAAVAKVELKTKLHNESLGTKIIIEGSELITQEACQCPAGTSISVKSLFYNVPARRKFLKTTSTETRHVLEEFTRVALANPDLKLSMFVDGKETYHLPGQSLHRRIAQVLGKRNEERIVPVEEHTDIVSVEGFIGKPEFAKKSKGDQYFFVNDRFIRSPYLNHAVYKAYTDYIDTKEYPLYVLNLKIDPEKIDINVHPSKHEVKFEDEKNVYTIVSAAVRHALSKFSVTPTLDFDSDPTFNRHEFFKTPGTNQPVVDNFTSKRENSSFMNREGATGKPIQQENWQELYTFTEKEEQQIDQISKAEQKTTDSNVATELKCKQMNLRYILVEQEDGFLLIDQRRAHQRILFESFLQSIQGSGIASQKLLFPETTELTPEQFTLFQEHEATIQQLGFEIEEFGKNTIITHATPADVSINNVEEFLETLLAELANPAGANTGTAREAIAKHLALYGAIRYGQELSDSEMVTLFKQLSSCAQPNYGIRKDKTFLQYRHDELVKAFTL